MTQTLWIKFAEDTSLPLSLTAQEKEKLVEIFDPANPDSLWSRAVRAAGLGEIPGSLVKWHNASPYMNWSLMTSMVTTGWIGVVPDDAQGYQYKLQGRFSNFVSFLKSQWKISRYFMRHINTGLPETTDSQIVESLALGFALLMLTLRLPAHDEVKLAQWLAKPGSLKPSLRRTLTQIQDVQKRRTLLSAAWSKYFPARGEETSAVLPAFFWNEPEQAALAAANPASLTDHWKGLPVSGGLVNGRAVIVGREGIAETADPLILIFSTARPETIEYFPRASAIIYAQGGVMSHACTIAREENINCVTAAGRNFLENIKELSKTGPVWLAVDGASGEIKLIKTVV
jgi:phosphohistidine swiveling domain-containing protein